MSQPVKDLRSNTATAALRDIAHHIDLAAHFAAGFDSDTFRADPRTVYAVTRCLCTPQTGCKWVRQFLNIKH